MIAIQVRPDVLPLSSIQLTLFQIPRRRDLNSFAQSCKQLHSVSNPILYEHVRLYVPQHRTFLGQIETYLVPPYQAFRHTKTLSIFNFWRAGKNSFDDQEDGEHYTDQHYSDGDHTDSDKFGDLAASLNLLIRLLIRIIPKNQLASFRYVSMATSKRHSTNRDT